MGSSRPFAFGVQLTGAPDRAAWLAAARRAEALGYGTISLPDHFGDQFAPFAALGAVAAVTERVRLSMGVLANDFRHPVVVAKEAATLDVVSDGRLTLGLGAGWMREEYDAAGIPFDPPGDRIERLGEAIRIVRALFAGEPVDHAGRWYRVHGIVGTPRPVQRPSPPILVGGGGQRMLGLAAREADVVSVVTANANRRAGAGLGRDATLDRTRVKVEWVRDAAGDRFPDLVLNTRVSIVAIAPDARDVVARVAPAHDLTPDELLASPHVLAGTRDEVVERLEQLRDELGFSSFTVSQGAMEDLAPVVEALTGR
ncbi:MAG TPA: TIGR03621 family F420-dependent LLM class oxidoreductase [Acidimicrobiia bacterium]|nr:TIGR03621 family F420-dependent LLM class oxidoreductase [Acidimicrobiia bacterium]